MALSAPVTSGDQLNPADIENHTLVVIPVLHQADVPTEYSKAGEPSPCITVNVADLSAEGGVPVVYKGVMWWNAFLQGGLKRQIGQTILGRMAQGQKTPGKNAPWQLLDIMTEQNWVDYANQWLSTPEGKAFELEGQKEANAVPPAVSAPAAATPAAAGPPPAPAGPPPSAPPATPPAAPPAPAGPPAAAPAGDLAAQLAGLPADEVAKMLAALQNQGQAAH